MVVVGSTLLCYAHQEKPKQDIIKSTATNCIYINRITLTSCAIFVWRCLFASKASATGKEAKNKFLNIIQQTDINVM